MADYVYVGRSRHRIKIGIYQVLTLGIYGRVWMYKLLREYDGHDALFLDRRPYLFLLLLPIIGPFFVKRRIAILTEDLLHHDVTSRPFKRSHAILLGLIPILPFFILYIQRVVNHHWRMHTKQEELELRRVQLVSLERRKSLEAQAEAKALAKEVAMRQKELNDLRSAAVAMREAEALRRRAEREGGVRRSPIDAIKRLGALNPLRRKEPAADAETADSSEPEPVEPAPEPAATDEAPIPAPEARPGGRPKAEPEPTKEASPAGAKPGFFARFLPKRKDEVGEGKPARKRKSREDTPDERPSRDEIKALRQQAKEEREAAKVAAKEEKRKAKERRKADRKAAKEARRAEKRRRKEEKRRAKEEARAAREKEKARQKEKSARKKEKPQSKPKKRAKKAR